LGKAIRVWLQENADRTARAKLIRLAGTFYFDFALLEVWEDSVDKSDYFDDSGRRASAIRRLKRNRRSRHYANESMRL
jgi:hypothetical protein